MDCVVSTISCFRVPLEIIFVTQYTNHNVDSIVSSANMKSEDIVPPFEVVQSALQLLGARFPSIFCKVYSIKRLEILAADCKYCHSRNNYT